MTVLSTARLPLVFTTGEAAAVGVGRHAVAGRVRRGEWRRLRRGVFCTVSVWEEADRRGRHLLMAVAAARILHDHHLSHLSAAAAWRWPLPLEPTRWQAAGGTPDQLTDVWLSRAPAAGVGTERRSGLRVLVAPLAGEDVVAQRGGWSVTSPARTVADCLRHLPAEDAVAIADAAGRQRLSRADVAAVLQRQHGWRGQPAALERLALTDPRRETWLESWSAVRLVARRIPLPEPQASVFTATGLFIGRVDWWWPQFGVVGEADGREKYLRSGRTVVDVERVLREEKRREDALRDEQLQVVRYGTSDAVALDALVGRLQRAFRRGDASAVTARVRPAPRVRGW